MMKRSLRFCMVTTFYPPYSFGGDGMFVHHLANALAQHGHQVEVVHCMDSYRLLSSQKPIQTYENHPNVTVHGLKSRLGLLSPLATQQTGYPVFKAARLREILESDFDVIHYHNISLVGGPKILEYGHAIKLYTLHEYWLICPTHVLFRFNRAVCTRPFCFLCSLAYKRPPQLWRYTDMLNAALAHVDAVIALSRLGEEIHHQRGITVPIRQLPSFVPAKAAWNPNAEPSDLATQGKPYFLFVGRLEKLKGLHTVIPLFRHYAKAELWITGQGSYEPQLRQLAAGSDNIRFLGHLPSQQLPALYHSAVALLVPSLCLENFPLVIMESLSQRTPTVVRNVGGLPEIIKESGGGLVYDTEEELKKALDRLVADPIYRNGMGDKGYETYQQNWTAEAHLAQYFELIREIAAARGQSIS